MKYTILKIVADIKPIYQCSICKIKQDGIKATIEPCSIKDFENEIYNILPYYIPLGWVYFGYENIRCDNCKYKNLDI